MDSGYKTSGAPKVVRAFSAVIAGTSLAVPAAIGVAAPTTKIQVARLSVSSPRFAVTQIGRPSTSDAERAAVAVDPATKREDRMKWSRTLNAAALLSVLAVILGAASPLMHLGATLGVLVPIGATGWWLVGVAGRANDRRVAHA